MSGAWGALAGTAPRLGITAASTRLPRMAYAWLVVLCVVLYLPGFVGIPPFDRDEARFAQASFQMRESGDYVDIRFQDEARHKKPVGIYWLQVAATELLGSHVAKEIWTYRVPSLLGAVGAVLLTAWGGARLFGAPAGLMAAVMLASCVVLGVEARMAKTDAVQLAAIVAAQMALGLVYVGRRGPVPGWGLPLVFWIATGVGILVKGPIVLLVSGTTVAVLAIRDRGAGWLGRLRPLHGLGIVALIAAPWLIAITIKTGGSFFAESVGHDMMGKVASGQEGKGLPPGFYLGTFWITFAPWSFVALLAVPWVWARRRDDAVMFAVAWIVPSWVVFEAIPTKLLHYTLPVFPAIALLAAKAALDHFGAERRRLFWLAAGLGGLGFLALAAAVAVLPWLADRQVNPWALPPVLAAAALFVWAVRLTARRREWNAALPATAAAALLYVGAYGAVLPALDGVWVSRQAARAVEQVRPCAGTVVASAGYSEPSLVFLLGTATRLGSGGEAAAHLRDDPACGLALVEAREETAFHAAATGAPRPLRRFQGFNYSNGRTVALTVYGAAAAD